MSHVYYIYCREVSTAEYSSLGSMGGGMKVMYAGVERGAVAWGEEASGFPLGQAGGQGLS